MFVDDLPAGGGRFRRPPGGYRYTLATGVVTQEGGELTGARPATVLTPRDPASEEAKCPIATPESAGVILSVGSWWVCALFRETQKPRSRSARRSSRDKRSRCSF